MTNRLLSLQIEANIFETYISISDKERNETIQKILSVGDCQNRSTNVQAQVSTTKIAHYIPEVSLAISEKINECVNSLPEQKNKNLQMCFVNMWSAVYKIGDFTYQHTHHPFAYSFVCFLKCDKDSAPLIFPGVQEQIVIEPEIDKLVVFPSYMLHYVPPQQQGIERIVVAGNMWPKDFELNYLDPELLTR